MATTLGTNLKKRASAWAAQLTSLAKSYAPSHIQKAISSKTEEKSDGTYIIRITADRRIAPDARAWEYGSGLKARRGSKGYINIDPKTKPFLVFAGTNDWSGQIIRTSHVNHPGIMAANGGQGYIAPAVNELRKRARTELDADVRNAIASDIRRSFGRAK